MTTYLDRIQDSSDLKRLPLEALPQLAAELREELLSILDETGGHLGSNLGAVEITIAVHYCFDLNRDRVVFDTGHQAYVHKILTKRRAHMRSLRQWGGVAAFPSPQESSFDSFQAGHGGTAISAAMGFAAAQRSFQDQTSVVAVVGDGALTCGMTFEALNHLSQCRLPILIVLNDNGESISPTVGGMASWGSALSLFDLDYRGPIDGHNLNALVSELNLAQKLDRPRLIHVRTWKGKGYLPAELEPGKYHAVSPGFLSSQTSASITGGNTYSDCFGKWMQRKIQEDPRVVVVSPAMLIGSGLEQTAQEFPDRCFDVGMAESHALTWAAAMAAGGLRPVVAIYSTFLQRAYDQVIHDIALGNWPVVLAVDRAGVVGPDGPTHGGSFDVSVLRAIPNVTVAAPADVEELERMLDFAVSQNGPVAVRYPKAVAPSCLSGNTTPVVSGRAQILRRGKSVALLAFGSMVAPALEAGIELDATVVNMRFYKPLDVEVAMTLWSDHSVIVTVEENAQSGGAGETLRSALGAMPDSCKLFHLALPDRFVEQGDRAQLLSRLGLDASGIRNKVQQIIHQEQSL